MRLALAARVFALALALAVTSPVPGCAFSASGPTAGGDDSGGTLADAAPLTADAVPDLCESWNPGILFLMPCSVADRGGELILALPGSYLYDTDRGELRTPGGEPFEHATAELGNGVRLVSAQQIRIAAGTVLRAVGARPLLLMSWGDIDVQGRIDVSSQHDGQSGAGANYEGCELTSSAGGDGGVNAGGGGGGGGGGFGGPGGPGGVGNNDQASTGAAGVAAIDANLLRGGCRGGAGGSAGAGEPALGGSGGGAVALSAQYRLTMTGTIHAGGAGGAPGAENAEDGGGGGGSGGMIWLDAASGSLGATVVMAANGGGGGEGSDAVAPASVAGIDGRDSTEAALGGQGGGPGGDGGSGNNDEDISGKAGLPRADTAGGGGGGGAGVILLDADLEFEQGMTTSPRQPQN